MQIKYRRDIDGLRSIAVLPVVLYHAGLGFPGGFVGVDIFFVISGYLISRILFKENDNNAFSILDFYERRIRRILPALTVVIGATFIAGIFIFLPTELRDLSESLVSSSLFVSNIYFWDTQNYFAGAGITKPLLHTWSLAVEEQFYIVWPVIIWLIYKFNLKRWRMPLMVSALVVSLVGAELMMSYSPRTSFYMFPLRTWELLIGAVIATGSIPPMNRLVANLLSVAGLLLIAFSLFLYSDGTRFPGLTAVPPCLGAALLLYVGERHPHSVGSRLLAHRPLVAIGLISYSLYLWHWPLLSFFAAVGDRMPSVIEAWGLVAASMLLAFLSWKYVEAPFRKPVSSPVQPVSTWLPKLRGSAAIPLGVGTTLLVTGLGLAGMFTHGFPGRVPQSVQAIERMAADRVAISRGCVINDEMPSNWEAKCFDAAATSDTRVALWGDSFARHFVKPLEKKLGANDPALLSLIATGCRPTPGITPTFGLARSDDRCRDFNDKVFEKLLSMPAIKVVVISGRWSDLAGIETPGEALATRRYLMEDGDFTRSAAHTLAALERSLDRVAAAFEARGVRVVFITEPPRYAKRVKGCVARAEWSGQSMDQCDTDLSLQQSFRKPLYDIFNRIRQRHANVTLYDPLPLLCPMGRCHGFADGRLLTLDTDHLTEDGGDLGLAKFDLLALLGKR